MARKDDVPLVVNPPVPGIVHVSGEDAGAEAPEPIQNPDCVRCVQYRAQEEEERAISGERFNLTMFRLKCWSKDLYDILMDIQGDELPEGGDGMKEYLVSIDQAMADYFEAYR